MHRRFEQTIVQWLRSDAYKNGSLQTKLPFITGFEFNEHSSLHSRLKQPVTVAVNADNNIVLNMTALQPKRDIAAPAHTTAVKMIICVAACSLLNDDSLNSAANELLIDYNNTALPAQEIVLPVTVEAGMLAVVMIALQYVVGGKLSDDKRWLPAGVVGGVWGGE